jgi:hypothetical protein
MNDLVLLPHSRDDQGWLRVWDFVVRAHLLVFSWGGDSSINFLM